ncbi:hypothetical protein [Methylobacterium sp. J-068]|uniref:hypothetical protein n=1 Tax=Methylobacterium sp. J-068 TaxID=2836649 RepID=UPI001FBA1926|nr:hypothetical protein [Methylobacterium sp. J-068]
MTEPSNPSPSRRGFRRGSAAGGADRARSPDIHTDGERRRGPRPAPEDFIMDHLTWII